MEYQNPQPGQGSHAVPAPVPVPVPGLGRTVISETAVAKVAGIAARAVPGVYSLGSGPSRALGAIRDAVGSSDHAAGVHAEVGETQVAVDISLVASYGTPLHSLANEVRAAVYRAVEELVGLQVIEVNVEITDVYVPPPVKPSLSGPAEREALL
ncbi:Asp23/Gls24 family envelope stress response protein [Pseudarthrobacter siccitolerans]